jgi:hypothetical protein
MGNSWLRKECVCFFSLFFRAQSDTYLVYKHTKMVRYLETARRLATYFLDNLPEDGVPPW